MQKPFIFVLMPFHQKFNDVYKFGIKETCTKLNTFCERLDEQIFQENMLDRIYNQINKADIIIADLSEKNPNVFYETGYAHALNKNVILLTQNADDIPFDLKHFPHIIYNGSIEKLSKEIEKTVNWYINNPKKGVIPNDFNLELFTNGVKLNAEHRVHVEDSTTYAHSDVKLRIDIFNRSNYVFDSTIKIGIITDEFFKRSKQIDDKKIIKLDAESFLHLSENYSNIYPSAWESFIIELIPENYEKTRNHKHLITVRLFSEMGIKDFPISLEFKRQENTF